MKYFGLEITNKLAKKKSSAIKAAQCEVFNFLRPKPIPFEFTRLGGDRDGSYLVPIDSLESLTACISPGVKNRKAFEDDLANKYRVTSHMCDRSSNEADFTTPLIRPFQTFRKLWLDTADKEDSISLKTWIDSDVSSPGDLLLQMDIEGAEYRILLDAPDDVLSRFRIIVLELHKLQYINDENILFQVILPLIKKLDRHFVCVHAHPNNANTDFTFSKWNLICPRLLEITLLRKDRVPFGFQESLPVSLPHPLDIQKNVRSMPQILLHDAWCTGVLHSKVSKYNYVDKSGLDRHSQKKLNIVDTHEYIIHFGTGGLVHMLRLLGNTIDYCKKNNKICIPFLENNRAFNISFYSFFERKSHSIADNDLYKNILKKKFRYNKITFDLRKTRAKRIPKTNSRGSDYFLFASSLMLESCSLQLDALSKINPVSVTIGKYNKSPAWGDLLQSIICCSDEFKIKKHIVKEIIKRRNCLPKKYLGVHFRNTDKKSDFNLIADILKRKCDEHSLRDIYWATDDITSLDAIKKTFPDFSIYNFSKLNFVDQTGSPLHYINKTFLAKEGYSKENQIIDAFSDMYFLVSSDFFISSPNSGFSDLVSIFRSNSEYFSQFYSKS